MDKLKMQTPNITDQNIEQIAKLFPNVITEKKDEEGNTTKAIDFDLLKQQLSEVLVEDDDERYRLDWPGKKASLLKANTPITKTLRPCREESVNFDTTENLYIEGDNFEVLKILQESYLNKIKMIYIDPPYNTGNDFVYTDKFKIDKEDYEAELGTTDEEGGKLFKNTDTNGRFHSDWLSMMYERLIVARDLLKDDGLIFISIGVEELANLKSITNEIYGEENFIEIFSWVKTSTPPALSTKSRKTNEYILCYEKSIDSIKYNGDTLDGGDQPLLNSGNAVRKLTFPADKLYFKEDKFPDCRLTKGKPDRVSLINDIDLVNGYSCCDVILEGEFKWTQEFLNQEILKGTTFIVKSDKLSVRFIRDEVGFKRPTNFLKDKITNPIFNKPDTKVGTNENASKYLRHLMQGNFFDYPKPITLIKYLINFKCNESDIILDFFSGSATTADAVMQLNAEDASTGSAQVGNRKFIMVQLPEKTDEKSEAYKAGYKTIADIGKERIRRAGKQIKDKLTTEITEKHRKEESDLFTESSVDSVSSVVNKLDIGFRVYKVDSSNMKDVFYHPENLLQTDFTDLISNIKEDRTSEDLLTQVILDLGLELNLPIEKKVLRHSSESEYNTIFIVQHNALVACFDDNINFEIVDEIAKLEPFKVVFKDASFRDDKDRINVENRFKRLSPETRIRVI